MMHGDISNITSSSFGFRLDGFLLSVISPQFLSVKDLPSYLKSVLGITPNALFNEGAVKVMSRISLKTEYSTPIVVHRDFLNDRVQELIDNYLPYSCIHVIDDQSDVSKLLKSDIITYYVDDNIDRVTSTNSPYAYTLSDLTRLFNFTKSRR